MMSTQMYRAEDAACSVLLLSAWGALGCGTDEVILTSSSVEAASRIASVEQALPSAGAGALDAGGGAARYFIGKYVQTEASDASLSSLTFERSRRLALGELTLQIATICFADF